MVFMKQSILPERLPKNSSQVIVKVTWLTIRDDIHAIANILNNCWQRRFTKDPRIEATVPLLENLPVLCLLPSLKISCSCTIRMIAR